MLFAMLAIILMLFAIILMLFAITLMLFANLNAVSYNLNAVSYNLNAVCYDRNAVCYAVSYNLNAICYNLNAFAMILVLFANLNAVFIFSLIAGLLASLLYWLDTEYCVSYSTVIPVGYSYSIVLFMHHCCPFTIHMALYHVIILCGNT